MLLSHQGPPTGSCRGKEKRIQRQISMSTVEARVPIVEKCKQNANLVALANEALILSKLPRLSFLV